MFCSLAKIVTAGKKILVYKFTKNGMTYAFSSANLTKSLA